MLQHDHDGRARRAEPGNASARRHEREQRQQDRCEVRTASDAYGGFGHATMIAGRSKWSTQQLELGRARSVNSRPSQELFLGKFTRHSRVAIQIKQKTSLKLPDVIIAASALYTRIPAYCRQGVLRVSNLM